MNTYKRNGFTLLELAVTLTLMVLLIIMGAPFTRAWINNEKVAETESVLQHAIGLARSHAMHSDGSQNMSNAPVSVVCIAGSDLEVRLVDINIDIEAGQKPCVVSKVVWRTKITEQVTPAFINENNEPTLLSEMYFDQEGNLASQYCFSAVVAGSCATSNQLQVTAEGADKINFSAL